MVHSMRESSNKSASSSSESCPAGWACERTPCTTVRTPIPTTAPTPSHNMFTPVDWLPSRAILCSLNFNAAAAGVVVAAGGAGVEVPGIEHAILGEQQTVLAFAAEATLTLKASLAACVVL